MLFSPGKCRNVNGGAISMFVLVMCFIMEKESDRLDMPLSGKKLFTPSPLYKSTRLQASGGFFFHFRPTL